MSRRPDSNSFTEIQVQQYMQLGQELQKVNTFAAQSVLALRRVHPEQKQHQQVLMDIAESVLRMIFLISCCEKISASGFHQQFSLIRVVFGTSCLYCEERGKRPHRSSSGPRRKRLEPDPAWGILVQSLLSLVIDMTTHAMVAECSSFRELNQISRSLHALIKVLLRQQRHMAGMSGTQTPKIDVVSDDSEICPDCGNRYEDSFAMSTSARQLTSPTA
jgi:hypothetical protein